MKSPYYDLVMWSKVLHRKSPVAVYRKYHNFAILKLKCTFVRKLYNYVQSLFLITFINLYNFVPSVQNCKVCQVTFLFWRKRSELCNLFFSKCIWIMWLDHQLTRYQHILSLRWYKIYKLIYISDGIYIKFFINLCMYN